METSVDWKDTSGYKPTPQGDEDQIRFLGQTKQEGSVMADYRKHFPTIRILVNLKAWSSLR
jgi:hypothetical protein